MLREDPGRSESFKCFCVRSICSENVEFLLAVESFSHLTDHIARVAMANSILQQFLVEDAQDQVQLPVPVLEKVKSKLLAARVDLFAEAEHHVLECTAPDSFQRFVRQEAATVAAGVVKTTTDSSVAITAESAEAAQTLTSARTTRTPKGLVDFIARSNPFKMPGLSAPANTASGLVSAKVKKGHSHRSSVTSLDELCNSGIVIQLMC
jgi:hypothetical protein